MELILLYFLEKNVKMITVFHCWPSEGSCHHSLDLIESSLTGASRFPFIISRRHSTLQSFREQSNFRQFHSIEQSSRFRAAVNRHHHQVHNSNVSHWNRSGIWMPKLHSNFRNSKIHLFAMSHANLSAETNAYGANSLEFSQGFVCLPKDVIR